jgi:hypothetical protein
LGLPECYLTHSEAELAVLEKNFALLFHKRHALSGYLSRRKRDLRPAQTRFADQLAADMQPAINRDDFDVRDDALPDMSYLAGAQTGAVMQQMRTAGPR